MAEKIIRPIQNGFKVTSPYGTRYITGMGWHHHPGIDYITNDDPGGNDWTGNRNVVAIDDGVVVADNDHYDATQRWVMQSKHSLGNYIFVQHVIDNVKYFALYAHLKYNNFNVGDTVKEGDVLGVYSDYGFSKGPHLHFQLYDANWLTIDPTPIIIKGLEGTE